MKTFARWLFLFPAIVAATISSWIVYRLSVGFAIGLCPADSQFHGPSFLTQWHTFPGPRWFDNFCVAPWFPATDRVLATVAAMLSVLAAGILGFYIAPSYKRLFATLSSLLAVGASGYFYS